MQYVQRQHRLQTQSVMDRLMGETLAHGTKKKQRVSVRIKEAGWPSALMATTAHVVMILTPR
ncbi:hypothetical protein BC940DRAFT_298683 [Gongronella butleri]|nr:hypothetical protein BC940DRAFT_298683 [Gongronella butleri]